MDDDEVPAACEGSKKFPEVGLLSLGNTCFANAIVQSLIHCPDFHRYLMSHKESECTSIFCMVCVLKKQQQELQNSSTSIAPKELYKNMNKILPYCHFNNQEDAHELLCGILKSLEDADINSQINIGIETAVRCVECNAVKITEAYQSHIQIDTQSENVHKGISKNHKEETLSLDDLVRCEKDTQAVLKHDISHLPSTLIIHIRRFTWESTHTKKDSRHVHITESVEVHDKKANTKRYILSSIIVHIGSTPQAGHYVSYARTAEGWYEFDDALVTPTDLANVLTKEAYILFYTEIYSDYCSLAWENNVWSVSISITGTTK